MKSLIKITLIFLSLKFISAKKVRYRKISGRSGGHNDLYGFLNRISPPRDVATLFDLSEYDYDYDYEPVTPSYTTPRPPTTTSTTPRPRTVPVVPIEKPLKEYCLKARGQNAYPLDCHKYVNCWDSTVILQSCHPANLVFNPATSQCDWGYKPAMKALCDQAQELRVRIDFIHYK